jgi:uncharacterized delta-60 repeat protein
MSQSQRATGPARANLEPLERRTLFAAGAMDPTFGGDGIVTGDPADFIGHLKAIDVQPDGKIVAVGTNSVADPFGGPMAVVRFNADGTIDRGFGQGGVVSIETGDNVSGLSDVKVLPGGDIVAVGTVAANTLAVRLNSDGSRDTSFGNAGVSVVSLSDSAVGRNFGPTLALEVAPSGALLIAGEMHFRSIRNPSGSDRYMPAVVRLTATGELDRSFGGDSGHPGVWHLPLSSSGTLNTRLARDVVLQRNGRILVTGDTGQRGQEVFVARLTGAGRPDPFFSGDGVVKLDFDTAAASVSTGNALAVDDDGGILLAGSDYNSGTGGGHFNVTRFTTGGAIDTSFGDNGTRPFGFGVAGMPRELKVQSDGKILAAGLSVRDSRPAFLVARLEANGDMDVTFGQRGRVRTNAPIVSFDRDVDMDLADDGRIVMAGNRPFPGEPHDADHTPIMARYLNDIVRPPEPITLQAEDATMRGARRGSMHGGYTGTGYADYANARGDYVEWTFNTPAAERMLTFRYASGAVSNRPLELRVNGVVLSEGLTFVATGGWATWRDTSVRVQLAAGTTRVRLTSVGFNGPNIDSLTIT